MVSKNHINAILRGDFNDLQNNVKRQSVAYTSKAHNKSTSTTFETMPFTIFNSPRNIVGPMRDSTNQIMQAYTPSESIMDEDLSKTGHSGLPATASNQNKFEPNAFRNNFNNTLHKAKVAKFDEQ